MPEFDLVEEAHVGDARRRQELLERPHHDPGKEHNSLSRPSDDSDTYASQLTIFALLYYGSL